MRRAAAGDVPVLAATLARPFEDDPIALWSCPSDDLELAASMRDPRLGRRAPLIGYGLLGLRLPRRPRAWLMWRDAR